jgi:hypothetical protein
MAVRQDINVGLIAFVGLVGSMLLLVIIWGVEGWYAYEVDLLSAKRFEEERGDQWLERRDEQYANIGDVIGNDTIYAGPGAAEWPGGGYRFTSRERTTAVIPIHAAMVEIVRQSGGPEVTLEQMLEADRQAARIENDAYGQYMTPLPKGQGGQQGRTGQAAPLPDPTTQPTGGGH